MGRVVPLQMRLHIALRCITSLPAAPRPQGAAIVAQWGLIALHGSAQHTGLDNDAAALLHIHLANHCLCMSGAVVSTLLCGPGVEQETT